ncbi:hypothetical protein APY03_6484 [Variovorax sp. WDL1]|nr:hypothetical protein APY03_6484 [Variovorax sp. WDL1]
MTYEGAADDWARAPKAQAKEARTATRWGETLRHPASTTQ